MGTRAVSCYEENERIPGPRGARGPQGLKGDTGYSAYEIAVLNGFVGTQAEWLASLIGDDAYEIAVLNGFVGTQAEWLESLIGDVGPQGNPGADGTTDIMPVTVVEGTAFTATPAVHKHLLRCENDAPTTITLADAGWYAGLNDAPYFSIVQRGDAPVTVVAPPGIELLAPQDFLPETRGKGSVITISGDDVAGNRWLVSGDMAEQ